MLLLLGARVLMVIASGSGLHVDEAQYWVWSRDLQWGYYSKPPVIAALIRASTHLAGDGVVGIRLLCMLCWLAASAVLAWLGAQMLSVRAGLWAAALLAATPASGLLGLVATTDAPLLLGWTVCMALTWQALRVSSLPVPVISPNFEMLPDAAALQLLVAGFSASPAGAVAVTRRLRMAPSRAGAVTRRLRTTPARAGAWTTTRRLGMAPCPAGAGLGRGLAVLPWWPALTCLACRPARQQRVG